MTKPVLIIGGLALALVLILSLSEDARDMAKKIIPRGLRNNNPGNLRYGVAYKGVIGKDKDSFAIFDTMANGLRAMSLNLQSYFTRHGIDTIAGIAARWSPSSENDLPNVVSNLSKLSGYRASEVINLEEPTVRARVIKAIAQNENGSIFAEYITQAAIVAASLQRSA